MTKYSAYDPATGIVFFPEIIEGYPYPVRYCRRCNTRLDMINALHHSDYPEIFKAVYICFSTDCPADDNGNITYYTRIYYSCDLAEQLFEAIFLRSPTNRKK